MPNYIKFLGTAGARFVMIEQLRSSAGTLLSLDGRMVLIDPGPGTLVRCANSRPKINPQKLDAILLSHRHVDHSTDVNVMMEAISNGGYKKRGALFAPSDCLEGSDPVVLHYVRDYIDRVVTLKPQTQYEIEGLHFKTSGPHDHAGETYGFNFESSLGKVSFLLDTKYFPELLEWYAGARVLVINVVMVKQRDDRAIRHLSADDARAIISAIKPEAAILTHFGRTMLKAKPWLLAEQMTKDTGVKVVAASDGMNFSF